jgi:hypothetical protein
MLSGKATGGIVAEYRMRVYQPREKLWQPTSFMHRMTRQERPKPKGNLAELAKEQNAPTLDHFILYEDDRFICEKVTR